MNIHPLAIVEPGARLASGVQVGPWSYIGNDVVIGAGTIVHSHVVIKGPTRIGEHNEFFQFASVGEACQDKKYKGEPTELVIGDRNVIREGCTIHRGTVQDKSLTSIGCDNLLMAYVHVAHDCIIGNHCILANLATLAGHVSIGDWAILGGGTMVHQFCQIGTHSMCAGGSIILKDVPAFVMAGGQPASAHGLNLEGLKRRGFTSETMMTLRRAYKAVYRQGHTLEQALQLIQAEGLQDEHLLTFISSLQLSSRGIVR
jgi:UDP-N-acetylglucosamine acyltransferase